MNIKILAMISVITAAVLFLLCVFLIIYFKAKQNALLVRLQNMLDDAIGGTFMDVHLDESKLSAIENSMWRYLSDSQMSIKNLTREKEEIQSLISDISHQAVTPISNIMLYSQLLEESALGGQEEILSIRGQTEKLDFLIEFLLKISRLETGIIKVHPKVQKVGPLLLSVKHQYMQKAEQKGISLLFEDSKETAVFDLKWTIEALSNVVDNGIKYTPGGGTVTVHVEPYSFFVRIDVADTGIGISETEQANVFSRFYRSDAVSEESGLGIGLYLAREVVKAQSGYMKITSKPGKGSVFSLFLPKSEMSQK